MSTNEEFDELARRKLQERRLEYQEADWQQARALLDTRRDSTRWGWWASGAGLLLLMAWFLLPSHGNDKEPSNAMVSAQTDTRKQPTATAGQQAESRLIGNQSMKPERASAASFPTEDAAAMAVQPQAPESAMSEPVPQSQVNIREMAVDSLKAATTTVKPVKDSKRTLRAMAGRTGKHESEGSEPIHHEPAQAEQAAVQTVAPVAPQIAGFSTNGEVLQARTDQAPMMETVPAARSTAPPSDKEKRDSKETQHHLDEPATTCDPAMANATDTATTDSTFSEFHGAPTDSALAAAPAPTTPPLVPERAPWELTVFGGVFSSKTTYSGGNSDEWSGALNNASAAGFGAELMHAGRHLGLGFGLHYGTYAEHMRLDAIDATSTSYQQYWYLAGIDTSVLVITDTLPGTPPTYTGQTLDTTIYVLAQDTDTVVQHQHLRDARNAVNRVSYVEVPLLADVHFVQGRWSIGLRGGPTIGLLSARRGAVPNSTGDGYTPFNEVAFREVVFGYTARAYIRYRFNAGWSVGFEPALRGQLLNSLGSGDLERRSSAKGVVLSLTYRLR